MNSNSYYLRLVVAAILAGTLPVACNRASDQAPTGADALQQAQQNEPEQNSPAQDEVKQDGKGGGDAGQNGGGASQGGGAGGGDTGGGAGGGDAGGGAGGADGGAGGGDAGGGAGGGAAQPQNFTSQLQALSTSAGSNGSGTATFAIANSNFTANVQGQGFAAGAQLIQHIHTGSRCPTMADDKNSDGFIDVVEAGAASGQILVPLDGNLITQMDQPAGGGDAGAGAGNGMVVGYPSADGSGNFTYTQSAPVDQMLANLKSGTPDASGVVAKLGQNEELNLASRVVTVHGVAATTQLPATVQSIMGLPAYMTLPVACGTIAAGGDNAGAGNGDAAAGGGDAGGADENTSGD